jgi:hypothetical protein
MAAGEKKVVTENKVVRRLVVSSIALLDVVGANLMGKVVALTSPAVDGVDRPRGKPVPPVIGHFATVSPLLDDTP